MEANPKISVIVPVYNAKKYLSKCIDSILAQTFINFEILLIDDGSIDGSGEICDGYAQLDNRMVVIHQENRGVSASRNRGLEMAKGKYVSFVDSDDYIHPQMLELLYRAAEENGCELAMADYKSVGKDESIIYQTIGSPVFKKIYSEDLLRELFGISGEDVSCIVCWNKLYAKTLLENICFPIEFKVSEDLLFNIKVFNKVQKAVSVEHDLYFYVQHSESTVHRISVKNYMDRIDAYCKCLDITEIKSGGEALCLMKLYKSLFSIRLYSKKEADGGVILDKIKDVHSRMHKRFIMNGYISFLHKILFMILYYWPFTYEVFIRFNEYKAKRKRWVG